MILATIQALILSWALAGDAWAREACERIGGAVGAISLETRIMEAAKCCWRSIHDMETLEMMGAGLIDDAQATARNIEEKGGEW